MNFPYFFVFDVESIGLHGEGYAVGFVVIDKFGIELECGYFAAPKDAAIGDDSDRKWVDENIPGLSPSHTTTNDVRYSFWEKWMEWKAKGAAMVTDCGWPVEARFLNACIDWDSTTRKWDGPYPLFDVSSILLSNGQNPTALFDRLENELPKHHPVCDARQSARILVAALKMYEPKTD